MLVESTSTSTAAGVTGAIRQAAGSTGASFHYLLATAQIESNLNPTRKASTSSATGLFQFIDQTWLATVKDAGPALGYGNYADAITRTKSGRMVVSDPAKRAEIMNLRKDPTANALMAGAFTKQNAATLKSKIGRDATDGELYMAHFLGATGASKLINAAANDPATKSTDLFPRAARSNNSIFVNKQGGARTAGEVYGLLAHKVDVAQAKAAVAVRAADAIPAVAPANAVAAATVPGFATNKTRTVGELTGGVSELDAPVSVRTTRILPPPLAFAAPTVAPSAAADAIAATAPVADAAPQAASTDTPIAIPTAARSTDAAQAPVFLDLFRTDGRQGVSALVSELWGPRASADSAASATAVAPVENTDATATQPRAQRPPLDLFGTGHPQRPNLDRRS